MPSSSVTVKTETANILESLEEYNVSKNYDFTTDDSERDIIEENLVAFQSGIGDGNDLKVYKQMDASFYQKFKAYFELTGKRTQREKRYEQVGFNYKVCLEAEETIEEQEGEVTFDIDVYPREKLKLEQYLYATMPVGEKGRAPYFTRTMIDAQGRSWKIMRDSSIVEMSRRGNASDEYKVEFVTPPLRYEDIETLQQIVRELRKAGAVANYSCGIHIHIDGANHNAQSLRRLVKFFSARQVSTPWSSAP